MNKQRERTFYKRFPVRLNRQGSHEKLSRSGSIYKLDYGINVSLLDEEGYGFCAGLLHKLNFTD